MSEEPVKSRTLATKLAAAVLDVGGKLKADKRNTEQNYNYISADKILAECGQALAKQGISVIPQVTGAEVTPIERPNKNPRWDARITMVELITDGESEILAPWIGFGSDYQTPDKAVYKAVTSGDKYFRMKLLSIGEGNEDSDHDGDPDEKTNAATRPANGNGKPATQRSPMNAMANAAVEQLTGNSLPPDMPEEEPKHGNSTLERIAKERNWTVNQIQKTLAWSHEFGDGSSRDVITAWLDSYATGRKQNMTPAEAGVYADEQTMNAVNLGAIA